MEEKTNHYTVLKSRMINGNPFLRSWAVKRINYLVDHMEIPQEEATELLALAQANGCDVLPEDAMGRLTAAEGRLDDNAIRLDDVEAALTDIFYGGEQV